MKRFKSGKIESYKDDDGKVVKTVHVPRDTADYIDVAITPGFVTIKPSRSTMTCKNDGDVLHCTLPAIER